VVSRATAELLDGARDQWERLVSPAGEGVGGAEGRGDKLCPEDELPRAAEVVAPLEDPNRAQEIPATEVGEAETAQPVIQRAALAVLGLAPGTRHRRGGSPPARSLALPPSG
jgi:hypothetical protein